MSYESISYKMSPEEYDAYLLAEAEIIAETEELEERIEEIRAAKMKGAKRVSEPENYL